jgi:triphosphatase
MQEIELKFQVPVDKRAELDAAVGGRLRAARTRLRAVYFDTPDRRLAAAGLALRMRREGRFWIQTLKGYADDGMTRLEHNVPRGAGTAAPTLEPAMHAGTPVGDAMLARLSESSPGSLAALYRTDILRRARALRTRRGRVELAFDLGRIFAEDASVGVCELEIELLSGSALAVIEAARSWVPRFGLRLDGRSKAERGDLLARGQTVASPRQANTVALAPEMDVKRAWHLVLSSCVDQVNANASQVATGEYSAEHVHQLRVGLRRFRSALALFSGAVEEEALREAASALFRTLGAARDQVVIEGEFAPELQAAMASAGIATQGTARTVASSQVSPADALRQTASQMFLLDLLAALHTAHLVSTNPEVARDLPLRDQLMQPLKHWHWQVVADVKRFEQLDDLSRHQLRKRAKRLRYAVEFCQTLFQGRAVRRYLRVLKALQERLGAITDVVMAIESFSPHRDQDPRAMFALGWLVARRDDLILTAGPQLKAFRKTDVFWK